MILDIVCLQVQDALGAQTAVQYNRLAVVDADTSRRVSQDSTLAEVSALNIAVSGLELLLRQGSADGVLSCLGRFFFFSENSCVF